MAAGTQAGTAHATGPWVPLMFSSRLLWKLVGSYGALIVSLGVVTAGVLAARHRERVESRALQELRTAALLLREVAGPAVASGTFDDLAPRLKAIAAGLGVRVSLFNAEGALLPDTAADGQTVPPGDLPPELGAARDGEFGSDRRSDPVEGTEMLYVAARLGSDDEPLGFVRVARDWASAADETSAGRIRIWSVACAAILLVTGLSMFWGMRLRRRLQRLTHVVVDFASGDLGKPVPAGDRDEIGVLAGALEDMAASLAARIGEVQRRGRERAESEEQLRTVLGSMVEGVVAVDNAERVLFANRAARSMLDFVGASPVGRPIWETVRNPTIQQVVRTALEGSRQSTVEFEVPRKQATVALIAAPLAGNPPPGVVLVLHDVTELRRLETLRRDFVSNVSHELKTPLTAIQAYTETLLGGAVDDPGVNRRFLQSIAEQADRLHELILDLLRLARIESGQDVFEIAPVPLDEVVTVCVEAQVPLASTKGVALEAEPPAAALAVQADPEALRTILENLVNNAVKYTPAGGRVTVRWEREGDLARIEVIDTGVGIPRKHHARIFERFYRVDKARSRDVGGTGLGLSIVKHLVQVFGGTVEVASDPGLGSTFTVRLPLA